MKEFNSIEEMMPYYDKEKNLFYIEDDIKLNFNLDCSWNITARNINARDIDVWNITAWNIDACNIYAKDILYYAVCFAYRNILCDSIKGERVNARHFVLDGELIVRSEQE